MSDRRQQWLAAAFVSLGLAAGATLLLLATGRLRVDSELLGLAAGGALVVLLWLGVRWR